MQQMSFSNLSLSGRASICPCPSGRQAILRLPVLPRKRSFLCRAQVTETQKPAEEVDDCGENMLGYCGIDAQGQRPKSQMTLGEKEQEFLEALSSFYYDEKPILNNEEFDLLKEELLWQGSKVAILSSQELKFLEAKGAYARGKPIMDDEQFDEMKRQLKLRDSRICAQGPRCSLRSKKMYADATPDYLKMTLLNVPATIVTLLVLYLVDDLTGFSVTRLVELPEPYGIIAVWGLVLPLVYVIATSITNFVLNDALILKASCPNCGAANQTYFGDIFTIAGSRDKNVVTCSNCKAALTFDAPSRTVVVTELPGEVPA
eukprot:jgi/Botrbrau1/7561/Bobra.0159s0011.1